MTRKTLLLLLALFLVLAACGDDDAVTTTAAGSTTTAAESTTTAADSTTTTAAEPTTTAAPEEHPCRAYEGDTLRVAMVEVELTKVAYLKGFEFLEDLCGITVVRTDFSGAPDTFRPLIAGEVDVVVGSSIGTLIAFATETDGAVKYIVGGHDSTDYIMVALPEFQSLDDLIGRRIGISAPGAFADTMTRFMLITAGYDPEDFEFVQIGTTGARMAAMAAGQIDGGPAHAADAIAYMEEQGFVNLYNFGEAITEYISGGSGSTVEWLEANPVLAQALVDTQIDAARWAVENRDEFLAYSLTQIPEDELPMFAREQAYDIYLAVGMFALDGAMRESLLHATMDIEQATGGIEAPAEPEVWADPSFVEDYLARNGSLEG